AAQRHQHGFGIGQRQGIFVLCPRHARHGLLDIEPGLVVSNSYAHRGALLARRCGIHGGPGAQQVALPQPLAALDRAAPALATQQEFAFDLDAHDYLSKTAIDSTCAVCGNMSMTPAASRVKPCWCTKMPASRAREAGWQDT